MGERRAISTKANENAMGAIMDRSMRFMNRVSEDDREDIEEEKFIINDKSIWGSQIGEICRKKDHARRK